MGQIRLRDPRQQVGCRRSALSHLQQVVRDPLPHRSEGVAGDFIHEAGDTVRALLRKQPRDLDVALCATFECGRVDQPDARVSEGLDRCRRRPGQCRNDANKIAATNIADRVLAPRTGPGDENAQKSFNVAGYKGQTVKISFKGVEDASLQTSFVVDDVSLKAQ